MIDFNLGLIESKAGVLVYANAGPDGSLGQAWRPLESDELAEIERIRRESECTVGRLETQDKTRDLRPMATLCTSQEEVDGRLADLGRTLFRIVVQDEVREVYERVRSAALDRQNAMLLLLRLRQGSSLQLVPWEILHDGYRFLAKDPRTAIVRHFEQPSPVASLEVEPPLRVLVTLASPRDLPPLALEEEVTAIHAAYEEGDGIVDIMVKRNISLDKLESVWRRARNEGKPFHVWHHCGHGGRRADAGQDGFNLYLERDGQSQPVEVDQLQEIVGFCPELRIAVFNVCHGGSSAGVVPALARLNVPVVIGFQQAVRDLAAVHFAAILHEGLLHIPVEFAVSQARSSLRVQRASDWTHALAFSRRRDRGSLLPKATREGAEPAAKPPKKGSRRPRGTVSIEVDTLRGTGNEVIGVSSLGGKTSGLEDVPNIRMKAREISGVGVRLVGFQMISGFSDADVAAREARVEKLLHNLEEHIAGRR